MRRVLAGEHSVFMLAAKYDISFAAVQKHVAGAGEGGPADKTTQRSRAAGQRRRAGGAVGGVLLTELDQASWRGRIAASTTSIAFDTPHQQTPTRRANHACHRRSVTTWTPVPRPITAEFAAPVERIWQVYADPRQLKVCGPPTYPATVVDHDLRPGGRVTYFMTRPEGDKHAGYGRSRRSTSHGASPSTTASPTWTSTRTRRCRSPRTSTRSPSATAAPARPARHLRVRRGARAGAGHGRRQGATSAINEIDELIA